MDFVADGRNQLGPWEKLKNQIFLGSDEFVVSLQRTLDSDASYQEILPSNDGYRRNRELRPPKHMSETRRSSMPMPVGLQFEGDWGSFRIALLPGESHCETGTTGKKQDLTPKDSSLKR